MASVRARKDGRLFFDFRFKGVRCRELSALQDTPANRKRMEAVLAKIEADLIDGTFDYAAYFPGSRMAARFSTPREAPHGAELARVSVAVRKSATPDIPLFGDFARQWQTEKRIEWRTSYADTVQSVLQMHLLPAFARIRLDEIDRPMVLSFRAELADSAAKAVHQRASEDRKLSPSTVNRIVGLLRSIMDEAALRYGLQNPCLSIKRLRNPRKDIEPFTPEEMRLILTSVRADYRPYLTLRFLTGLRSGEAHGLKWKHVDFGRKQLLIRETWANGRTEYTKTDGSQREVHISAPVEAALLEMRPAGYADSPSAFDDDYVFQTRAGNPIDNSNFTDRVWKPLLRHLGIKYRRPYQMRHTCATLWLAAGEAPEWIARQLGHTTTELLFRTYSRYVPNLTRNDGAAFDRLIATSLNGEAPAANKRTR